MDKKKASVKNEAEKASDNESLAETQDTHRTSLKPNCQPYVVIKHLEKSKVDGATRIKFKAKVHGDAVITNFAFDLQLNQEFPYKFKMRLSDDHKKATVKCWFYDRLATQGTESLPGDPEDDLVVVVVNSRKFKNFQA
jgi:hypothetical protein